MARAIAARLRRVLRRTDRSLRAARSPEELISAFERFTEQIVALNARARRHRRADHTYLALPGRSFGDGAGAAVKEPEPVASAPSRAGD